MKTSEIVSFNHAVPEMSSLLDLDGAELDQVIGGVQVTDCPKLTSCTTYGSCTDKCGVDLSLER